MSAKVLTVVGARPQFVKAATVTRAFGKRSGIVEVMVHTGQHFDAAMSEIFFSELQIPDPAYNLAIHGGGHGDMTGRMMMALEPVMEKEKPDGVLVYGDTNSTLAGALTASKLHIPVFHVEAGLRSFNRRMPEEINRVLTDHVSSLLLCPTSTAVANLAREGISKGVIDVGDVMFDATRHIRDIALRCSRIVEQLALEGRPYAVLTLHRAENTGSPERLQRLLDYVMEQAGDAEIVFPVHPRTRDLLTRMKGVVSRLRLVDPLGYVDMHRLLIGASMVMTDSGGLQKEAYFHRVPCITLRDETEWVETIAAGWNRLWSYPSYRPRHEIAEYGNGQAAELIVNALVDVMGKRSSGV